MSHGVGIFWDIENCAVPSGFQVSRVAAAIRTLVKPGQALISFQCIADISKLPRQIRIGLQHESGTYVTLFLGVDLQLLMLEIKFNS